MSELKAFRIIQGDTGGYGTPSYKCDTDGNRIEEWSDVCEVYDRFEADKVIAHKDKEISHHKFKRCLDKAEICRHEWCVLYYERKKYRENPFLDHLKERKNRHREKWLELAEKFKEAK